MVVGDLQILPFINRPFEELKYMQKAIERDENEAEGHRIMGSIQMLYRDFEAAEYHHCRAMELIEAAVAQDPFLPVWCIEERGIALFALGGNAVSNLPVSLL
jgi:hypothetical protein